MSFSETSCLQDDCVGGAKSVFQAGCSSHNLGFWVSSCTLYCIRPRERGIYEYELFHNAKPVFSATTETSSVRQIEVVCAVSHLAPTLGPGTFLLSKHKEPVGSRECALYLQEVCFCRSFWAFQLSSLSSFPSLKERSPCFKLPAFNNCSTCLGAWDLGSLLVLLKMEFAFLFISPFCT